MLPGMKHRISVRGGSVPRTAVLEARLEGLFRGLKLAVKPTYHSVRFQRIRPVAVKTLERALSPPIGR